MQDHDSQAGADNGHAASVPIGGADGPPAGPEQLLRFVEGLGFGLFRTTEDGRFLQVNDVLVRMLGYDSQEELLSVRVEGLYVAPVDRQRMLADLRRRGVVHDVRLRQRRKDGSVLWVALAARLERDARGGVRWIEGMLEDITAREENHYTRREQTEQQVRVTREYLDTIIRTSQDGIFVVDADGCFEFVNDGLLRQVGWAREELIGTHFLNVIPPEHHEFLLARWEEVQSGHGTPYETDVLTHDGGRKTLLVSHRHVDIAGERKYCVVTRDVTDRHLAEQALRDSEARYRALFENANDAIFILDGDTISDCNEMAVRLLGCRSPHEVMGRTPWEFSPPVQRDGSDSREKGRRIRDAVLQGHHQCYDWCIQGRDGTTVDTEVSAGRIEIGGKRCGMLLMRDVTERVRSQRELESFRNHLQDLVEERTARLEAANLALRQEVAQRARTEASLRESENRFRTMVETIPGMVWMNDIEPPHVPLYLSDNVEAMFGYPRADFLEGRRVFWDLVLPEDVPAAREEVAAGIAENRPMFFQLRCRRRDGRILWIQGTGQAVLDAQNRPRCLIGTIVDITERKEAEEALARSEERLRAILGSLHETVVSVTDPSGRLTAIFYPPGVEAKYGLNPSSLIGRTPHEIFSEPVAKERVQRLEEVLRTGRTVRFQYSHDMPRGSFWFEATFSPLRDAAGQTSGVVSFVRDITERRLAERELRKAHRELVRAREHERRRLARDLHDSIGQQAVAIRLDADALAAAVLPACPDLAGGLKRLGSQAGALARDIRAVCHGLYPPTLETLGLVPALRQLARDCPQHVAVTVHCPQTLVDVRFAGEVEIAVYRIVQEAVSNALRHGGGGGIDIRIRRRHGALVYAVVDDGSGFDPQAAHEGMGMHTMRQRAETIGASFRVRSRRGQTRIEVLVPQTLRLRTRG